MHRWHIRLQLHVFVVFMLMASRRGLVALVALFEDWGKCSTCSFLGWLAWFVVCACSVGGREAVRYFVVVYEYTMSARTWQGFDVFVWLVVRLRAFAGRMWC